jgi:hypothetical protein
LKPWEFERLQAQEFSALLEGYTCRQEMRRAEAAYWMSHILNISGKTLRKAVSTNDLLKPFKQKMSKRDKKKDREYLLDRFKNVLVKSTADDNNLA